MQIFNKMQKQITFKIKSLINDIKNNKKSMISSILMTILILGFLLSSLMGTTKDDNSWVLRIGSEYISKMEFENAAKKLQNNSRSQVSQEQLIQQTLNMLALEKAAAKDLEKYGINVTDETARNIIKNDSRFIEDGKFKPKEFAKFLKNAEISESEYTESVKSNIIIKLAIGFGDAFSTNDEELATIIYKSRKQKRTFDLYELNINDVSIDKTISDNEISEFYNSNKMLFAMPQKLEIEYINGSDIAKNIPTNHTQNEIQQLATQNKISEKQAEQNINDMRKCEAISTSMKHLRNQDDLKNIAESFDVKTANKTIELNESDKLWSQIQNPKQGQIHYIYTNLQNPKCYDFIAMVIKKVHDHEFKSFSSVKSEITKKILNNRSSAAMEIIQKEINKNSEKKDLENQFSMITKYKFKKIKTETLPRDSKAYVNPEIIKWIFTISPNEITKAEKNKNSLIIAHLKNIEKFTQTPNKQEVEFLSGKIGESKKSDIYRLYYMNMQNRYDIEINKEYFSKNVIK